jgi:hypothetical protein
MPHQCRCAICGEIGVIVPGLPNVFAQPEAPAATVGESPGLPAVCTHGYTVCMVCKFPPVAPHVETS